MLLLTLTLCCIFDVTVGRDDTALQLKSVMQSSTETIGFGDAGDDISSSSMFAWPGSGSIESSECCIFADKSFLVGW